MSVIVGLKSYHNIYHAFQLGTFLEKSHSLMARPAQSPNGLLNVTPPRRLVVLLIPIDCPSARWV